jgi:hypothetical protein
MRLTKFNEETGQYEYIEKAKTRAEYRAQRKAAIQKLGEFEENAEWVSAKDRLPKPFISVLVYVPDEEPHPSVREGWVNPRGEWYGGGYDRIRDEVAAWKEMPEPPEMKGADDDSKTNT